MHVTIQFKGKYMNISKINNCSFGCTFCDVPGKTAKQSRDELFEIQRRERKAGYGYGSCPVPGETPIKPYDLELMGVKADNNEKVLIDVADINDEVIQSHLDAIAQRNKALLNMTYFED